MSLFLIRLNTCTYLSVLKLSWIKVSQGKAWKLKLLTPISPITWSLMSRPSEFFFYMGLSRTECHGYTTCATTTTITKKKNIN